MMNDKLQYTILGVILFLFMLLNDSSPGDVDVETGCFHNKTFKIISPFQPWYL